MSKEVVRPTWTDYWMNLAVDVAIRSTCRRASHGAVIVGADSRVISTGYNGSQPGQVHCHEAGCVIVELDDGREHCLRAIHADMNALWSAVMTGQSRRLVGSAMYATGHPCPRCLPIILASGVKDITYVQGGYTNLDMESPSLRALIEAFEARLTPWIPGALHGHRATRPEGAKAKRTQR